MLGKLGILAMALAFLYMKTSRRQTNITEEPEERYDYVIVGAGTAGCVLANRLSENPHVTVLLIEAGGDDLGHPEIFQAGMYAMLRNSSYDWVYKTVPQKDACKMCENQRILWPRGKLLGGSSSINGMLHVRGGKEDYDLWEKMGAKGWSYEEVLPYFKKSENILIPNLQNSEDHGYDGPLPITEAIYNHPIVNAFLKAGEELGYPVRDLNGGNQYGVMTSQSNIKNGVRQSTAEVFLRPALERPNLHVIVRAHVTKILFDGKRATGVQFIHYAERKQVAARKEVILSAGAVGSPHILLLSGVGPSEQLKQFGIPVVADLPVGKHLQDHLGVLYPEFFVNVQSLTPELTHSLMTKMSWLFFGKGPLASSALEGMAFFNTEHDKQSGVSNNVQLHLCTFGIFEEDVMRSIFGPGKQFMEKYDWDSRIGKNMFILNPTLLKPHSEGEITLASANPFDYPNIDPKYLSDKRDIKALVEGIKVALKFSKTKAFMDIGTKPVEQLVPGCDNYKEDEYLQCVVRHTSITIYHPTGTCKMGAVDDSTAVVDPQLRVHGLEGLRVVDASIMPDIVAANTHAPVVMIAEKAADIIKMVS